MHHASCFFVLLTVGCLTACAGGGDSRIGDGGASASEGAKKDQSKNGTDTQASKVCRRNGSGHGSGSGPPRECHANQDWLCGDDTWSVQCECPEAMCKCFKGGNFLRSVPYTCPKSGETTYICEEELIPSAACGVPL